MADINWTQFIEDYYDGIYRYCHQFLFSKAEAEDATQQAFLKAWRSFSTLKSQESAKSWIYSIARNVCIDRKRWWKRHFWALSQMDPGIVEPPQSELSLSLRKLIGALPQKQREVFILRHWHGFSTRETAKLLKISEGTVKSHLKRAIDALKEKLSPVQEESDLTTNQNTRTSYLTEEGN